MESDGNLDQSKVWSDRLYRIGFGAIGWPWLLVSLWGGTKASKARLLERLGLPGDALPHLGSWKADTGFLHRIVDAIEELRPATVVELGSGASSLVCARALQLHGGGRLVSYDQHAAFVTATAQWLREEGVAADMRHAPLQHRSADWPGTWYSLSDLPESIDLLIIDGPPWAVHPYVRGAADMLFERLTPGGIVLLDDANRPGERIIARRWRQRWRDMTFERVGGSTKGTLVGRKARQDGHVVPRTPASRGASNWRRATAAAALIAIGWIGHYFTDEMAAPARAQSFVDEASASYAVSLAARRMGSQVGWDALDRQAIGSATGLSVPPIPSGWTIDDVQVFPSDAGMSVALVLHTERGETVALFIKRAETMAEELPVLTQRDLRPVAYWENGPFAYALTGELNPERMLALSAKVAGADRQP
jgi:predicted O-methyltransferase YrrM/anti-sigma factor RsiW